MTKNKIDLIIIEKLIKLYTIGINKENNEYNN